VKLLRWVVIGMVVVGLTWASPASELFDQASFLITERYGGGSAVNLGTLIQKYSLQLEMACNPEGEECPYERASPIIHNLVADLGDAHSYLFAPGRYARLSAQWQGEMLPTYGLETLRIENHREHWVTKVLEGSPADQAGVRRGDRIVAMNGGVLPQDEELAYSLLEEPEHERQTLELTLRRASKRLSVLLTAAPDKGLRLPSIYMRSDGVAVLSIPDFDNQGEVGPRIHQLVRQAQTRGAKAMVVDLRENPGGLLSECVSGAGAFLGSLVRKFDSRSGSYEQGFRAGIVYTRNTRGPEYEHYRIARPALWKGPLAVLVNRRSASCAEFFALDIQLSGRGQIVGETTSGVGNTATEFLPLLDGSGLQLTTGKALRGKALYPEKVIPNVAVKDDLDLLAQGKDVVLERAIEELGIK
jgi:carboxyl-terminal processing protease